MSESAVNVAGIEEKLEQIDQDIQSILKGIQSVNAAAKKAARASALGALRDLQNAISDLDVRLNDLRPLADELIADSEFDLRGWMDSGGYVRELLSLAESAQLRIIESDGKLLCYPSVVQILPSDQSIAIDKKRDKNVRPSVIVKKLKDNSQARIKFKAEAFIEALASAYELHVARPKFVDGSYVKLVDLYEILTLLLGSRSYSKQEFARDVYLLDQSGILQTKKGRTLSFAASATTRGSGLLETVAKGGQVKLYSTVSFKAAQ